jgi:hypothetical protein
VQPDVRVAPEQALEVAQAAALRRIAASRTGVERLVDELSAEALEARLKPVAVDPARLKQWAGNYDEGRSIEYRDGRLWYRRREGMMADELIPLPDGRFALGAARISFQGGARIVLSTEAPDGTKLSYARMAN